MGKSLYLLVHSNGSKYWRFKYRLGGREKHYAIGVFPDVSLRDARKVRDKVSELLKSGIDPMEVKRQEAKHRAKPEARKKVFQMDLSRQGELTIETDIYLAPAIEQATAGGVTLDLISCALMFTAARISRFSEAGTPEQCEDRLVAAIKTTSRITEISTQPRH